MPTLLFLVISLGLLIWFYWKSPGPKFVRWLGFWLKAAAFALLAACVLEPLWSDTRAKPGANFFAILADNSQGMQIRDRGETTPRSEQLFKDLTDSKAGWQLALSETFQVRRYYFDSTLQISRDFSEMQFDGRSSSLAAALRRLGDRYQGQPLAGVLLLTDGNATDIKDKLPEWRGLPPIYPVLVGKDQPERDVAVQELSVSETAFEDAPVTIQASVTATGYEGRTLTAQLVERSSSLSSQGKTNAAAVDKEKLPSGADGGLVKAAQSQTVRRAEEQLVFRFQVRPDKYGLLFYQVRILAKEENAATPESPGEATLANNQHMVVVDRGKGPYRVLYVSGRPNWEYKFLNRALAEEAQVNLVGLIRMARREPKFTFKGRAGESSNPLFRGFDKTSEETERYDQPVLVRLNTRDELELKGGYPKTAEELYSYDAVIVDDLESDFFTYDQMLLTQKFVSERGGGFLMLGGADSLNQGKYERTPIGEMLPVYLDRVPPWRPSDYVQLTLTREGWLQPWARLRRTEDEEKERLAEMPAFQSFNRSRAFKPGASVIAAVQDRAGQSHPALIVQRFGFGRSAVLALGDYWRWGLSHEERRPDFERAWRQLIRWLVTETPHRVQFRVEMKNEGDESARLHVQVRDEEFRPLDNAAVTVQVRWIGEVGSNEPGQTNWVSMSAEQSSAQAGVYETTFLPRKAGGYEAIATVKKPDGSILAREEAGWTSDPNAEEFKSLKPNRALLEEIARQTGGEMIEMDQLESFARKLPHRKAPVVETWSFPLWHQPSVFLLALACLALEWGLRRWKGLA